VILSSKSLEKEYPPSVNDLAVYIDQPHLAELIQCFLHAQSNETDDNADIPLMLCPPFDSEIMVFHSATSTIHTSDHRSTRGMCHKVIRSTPSWCHKGACRDCIFVEHNTKVSGMRGLDVVCMLMFMSFMSGDMSYPCALVHWFTHVSEEPDELTGMWMVQPEWLVDGSPILAVIPTDCILCSAHLIPIFGKDFIPKDHHFSMTLDIFTAYYVNRFIDHHMFKTIF
jgi:hypothetical protein